MTTTLIAGFNVNTYNVSTTNYVPIISGGMKSNTGETAGPQVIWEDAGSFSNLYARVATNTITANSTVTFRKAAGAGNQTFTIGSSATGEFQDSTHTDSVTAGQKIDIQTVAGGTGTSMVLKLFSVNFAPTTTSNTINKLGIGTQNWNANATYYNALGGNHNSNTTEANAQFKCKTTGTLQNLFAGLQGNTVTATSTINTRIGGVNGNCTISIGASTAGYFEDTTHTDSVSSGNLLNYAIVVGATGTSIQNPTLAVDFLTTNGATHYVGSPNVTTFSLTTGDFSAVTNATNDATEANEQLLTTVGFTASNLETFVISNTNTATINFRVGAANGNQLLSIGSAATGYFEDTTNSDVLTTSSEINYKWTAGGTIKIDNIGFLASYAAAAAPGFINWLATYNDQVSPAPSNIQNTYIAQEINPQPIAQTDWYAFYPPEVKPALPAAQNSFVAQKIQPSPIAQNDFYPAYPAEVVPWPTRAQYSVSAIDKRTPSPIGQNNWYPVYDAQVKPGAKAAQFSTLAQLLASPISINNFYPLYSATVKIAPLNNPNFVTPPIPVITSTFTPIYWYPKYAAEVKPAASNNANYYSQLLPAPIVPLDWYPAYPDNVNGAPSAAQFGITVNPLQIIFAPVPPPTTGGYDSGRERSRRKAKVQELIDHYNRLIIDEEAQALLEPVIREFVDKPKDKIDAKAPKRTFTLPAAERIDFAAIARNAEAKQQFLQAVDKIIRMRQEEEEFALILLAAAI